MRATWHWLSDGDSSHAVHCRVGCAVSDAPGLARLWRGDRWWSSGPVVGGALWYNGRMDRPRRRLAPTAPRRDRRAVEAGAPSDVSGEPHAQSFAGSPADAIEGAPLAGDGAVPPIPAADPPTPTELDAALGADAAIGAATDPPDGASDAAPVGRGRAERGRGAAPSGAAQDGAPVAIVEATIERIVPGGAGLAHADGQTLFVGLAAPGDRVRVRVDRRRGKVAFGEVIEVLEPGPDRVKPPCPYFGPCGGCDFQQLSYDAQLAAKVEILRDCLRRQGGLASPPEIPITPSPDPWAYRARAEWQLDPKRNALGYFARDSRRIVDVEFCPISAPGVQGALTDLRRRMATKRLPGALAEAKEVRAVAADDAVGLWPPEREGRAEVLTSRVAGERYRYDAGCFFQANPLILEPLVAEALRHAPPPSSHPGRTSATPGGAPAAAVDLYCGVGLFTLPLARRFGRVIGVETHPVAARYAARNLHDAGLTHARVEAARVDKWLARRAAALSPVAFVLLDPPRTGVEAETMAGLLALNPERIAYVSCDPATLARDLKALLAGGYRLEGVAAFDMFPQTHHVEAVAHLTRGA